MLKLKLQYFGYLMRRTNSLGKTLMLGKTEGRRKRRWQRMRWTIKQAECLRIDAFELWCWRRLLRVPRTARRSNHWILNEINNEYSLEGLMLRLKLQSLATWCKELTHWKRLWCWEILKAGGEGDDRKWDGWMASLTRWTWVWESSGSWWWAGKPGLLQSMGPQRVGKHWVTELKWF